MGIIKENVKKLLKEVPSYVSVVAATKTREINEIKEAIEGGIKICGENYLQEAEKKILTIGKLCEWHFIGTIQSRKIKKIVELFDMIQSVGSIKHAEEIAKCANEIGKLMPILLEVNIAKEPQKSGFLPEEVYDSILYISSLRNIEILGLMTMGPVLTNENDYAPFFREMKDIFENLKSIKSQNIKIKILSMGMSDSYKIAIENGSNMVRIGTAIFGPRLY